MAQAITIVSVVFATYNMQNAIFIANICVFAEKVVLL